MKRLLAPKDIAVIGGGAWCESIVEAARKLGFKGTIMPVHPSGREIAGLRSFQAPGDLPKVPDAAFVGVNRDATLEIVGALSAMGAGGAVCFASGFREAAQEDESAPDREAALIAAAGAMPILGPNCYGFLNALDGAGLWPDQHGLHRVTSGVAIITQSSNIAINLTMQSRGLPIGQVITCGNQAQTRQAELASAALDDPRITAIGLHIEGFGDLRVWEALARKAHDKGIPLIALKAGRSDQARAAALSHTASMTGADAGAEAFLRRLGITRAHELPVFLEALKIAHLFGPLPGARLGSISCSGGEAALVSDTGFGEKLSFPPLSERQRVELRAALGPRVALANPLDYHTYIWRDEAAMSRAWAAMAGDNLDLVLVILDYPRADICDPADWAIATRAAIAASRETGARYAVCATLPELMPERTAKALFAEGVLPISGLDHGLKAIAALADVSAPEEGPVLLPGQPRQATLLDEAAAKEALGSFGLAVPKGYRTTRESAPESAATLEGKLAIKVLGLAHKTGAGGIALGISGQDALRAALERLAPGPLLIEEMIDEEGVELLIGVTRDAAHGYLLTLGAGGTRAELLADNVSFLVPAARESIAQGLESLRLAPLLRGYRGAAGADMPALFEAIDAVQAYVMAHATTLEELEINPLLATPNRAIALDALIRKASE